MHFNKFLWKIYQQSAAGQSAIQLFTNGSTEDLLKSFSGTLPLENSVAAGFIDDMLQLTTSPVLPDTLTLEEAEALFDKIIQEGITLSYEDHSHESYAPNNIAFLGLVPLISTWLYYVYPDYFKPYFFLHRFHLLTRIADAFGIDLPPVPLKQYKAERIKYYWSLCKSFSVFQEENELSAAEFCAFLYDFAPNYLDSSENGSESLPQATQVWLIGGDKYGVDFEFLDRANSQETTFWQGNEDTRKGDILVMYCLAPRSYIHSIWRATDDGIADPFFHYYSSIYIGHGQKVPPISLTKLKNDPYFKDHPLVRKNMQGVSGYPLTAEEYLRLQKLMNEQGGSQVDLPLLYSHTFPANDEIRNEREVETVLIEPLLIRLGYTSEHWVRQLSLRMGRGERNFPDYAFITTHDKGYETASMLIESKFWIRTNRELEETFKQVWSYGQRLSAKILVIADKEAIWIYERNNNSSFDRTKYTKKFWKELEQPEAFRMLLELIGNTK